MLKFLKFIEKELLPNVNENLQKKISTYVDGQLLFLYKKPSEGFSKKSF